MLLGYKWPTNLKFCPGTFCHLQALNSNPEMYTKIVQKAFEKNNYHSLMTFVICNGFSTLEINKATMIV